MSLYVSNGTNKIIVPIEEVPVFNKYEGEWNIRHENARSRHRKRGDLKRYSDEWADIGTSWKKIEYNK